MITLDKYRSILIEGKRIRQLAKDNYELLKEKADKADIITYGTRGDDIGLFCPSLIKHRINKNFTKGKLINRPSKRLQRYNLYESAADGEPLRLREFNKFGCDLSYYFFKERNTTYAVPFFKETIEDYPTYTYSITYEHNNLISYNKLSCTGITLISEEYDYSQIGNGVIVCECCDYVDTSAEVSELTPAQIAFSKSNDEFFRRKYSREAPSMDIVTPRIKKRQYKLFYGDNKLLNIEEL